MSLQNELKALEMTRGFAKRSLQNAWNELELARSNLKTIRSIHVPVIDSLKFTNDQLYLFMDSNYKSASTAYTQGLTRENQAHVKAAKAVGSVLKATNDRRKELIEEIKLFEDMYILAKNNHEKAELDYNEIDSLYAEKLIDASDTRDKLRAQKAKIIRYSNIPAVHSNNYKLVIKDNNPTLADIYFGGIDKPDGFGHGHYQVVLDELMDPVSITRIREARNPRLTSLATVK